VGLPGLQAALERKAEELRMGARLALAAELKLIEADAKATAPRDTGELADGIEADPLEGDGSEGAVHTTARHSAAVEFGTFKTPAQPFMKPTAERARRRIPKTFAAALSRVLGG
jgi:HK97 gp10 family phage protein